MLGTLVPSTTRRATAATAAATDLVSTTDAIDDTGEDCDKNDTYDDDRDDNRPSRIVTVSTLFPLTNSAQSTCSMDHTYLQ